MSLIFRQVQLKFFLSVPVGRFGSQQNTLKNKKIHRSPDLMMHSSHFGCPQLQGRHTALSLQDTFFFLMFHLSFLLNFDTPTQKIGNFQFYLQFQGIESAKVCETCLNSLNSLDFFLKGLNFPDSKCHFSGRLASLLFALLLFIQGLSSHFTASKTNPNQPITNPSFGSFGSFATLNTSHFENLWNQLTKEVIPPPTTFCRGKPRDSCHWLNLLLNQSCPIRISQETAQCSRCAWLHLF